MPDLQKKLEEAEAGGGKLEELQTKYDEQVAKLKELQKERKEIQDQFDSYKSDVEHKETARAKAKAYRVQVLEAAGIASKYIDDVMGVSKLDGIELDEQGKVKDAEELVNGVKEKFKSFVSKKRTDGGAPATPPTPPAGSHPVAGAHERAVQINKEYRERMYGKPREE